MDSDFGDAIDRIKEIAKAAAQDAEALEARQGHAGDAIEIRAHLDRLCGQLTDIHAILTGDAEQEKEGLLKRFGRWSRLVRADLRQLDEDERRSLHERILAVEREALAELNIGSRWTGKLLEELRRKLATTRRVELTDRALAQICADIDALRAFVCRSGPTPGRRKLDLILKGVHGTIKVVADIGKLAGDPTVIMGICGLYSVYSGGSMIRSAVRGLQRIEDAAARAAANAEEEKQKAEAEDRTRATEAAEEEERQHKARIAKKQEQLKEKARKNGGKYRF
jgi:hypothetical protein